MITVKVLYQEFTTVDTDLAVVTFFKDIIPLKGYAGDIDWLLSTQISSLIKEEKIFGTYRETVLLNSKNKIPANKILILGLGSSSGISNSKIEHAYSSLARTIINMKAFNFCLGIFARDLPSIHYNEVVRCVLDGLLKELLSVSDNSDFHFKIIEEDEKKVGMLRKTVRKTLNRYKKNKCKIELD